MSTPLRISPIALDVTNRKVLEVAINLINDESSDNQLLLEDDVRADLLVIDGDTPLGQDILSNADNAQIKLVISQQQQQGENIIWQQPPVRVTDMQDLLNRIYLRHQARHPASGPGQTNPAEITSPNAQVPTLENTVTPKSGESIAQQANETDAEITVSEMPAEEPHAKEISQQPTVVSLFHILLNARQQKICLQISAGENAIFIGGHEGTVAAKIPQHVQAILTSAAEELQLEQMDVVDFAERIQGLHITPLDNLLWQAGVEQCDGQLLAGLDMNQTVRLKAWPNFTRNGFRQSHFKLATIMAQQPISLNTLSEKSGVAENEIISFYNAAYAVGLIDQTNTALDKPMKNIQQPTQQKGLLRRLANKFRRR